MWIMLAVPGLGCLFATMQGRAPEEFEQGFFDAGFWDELVEGTRQLVIIEMAHQDTNQALIAYLPAFTPLNKLSGDLEERM